MSPSRSYLQSIIERCGVSLSTGQHDQLWAYHGLLRAANAELNLTRIHNFENMVLKHYVDSLLVLRFVELPSPLVDMGSGAGLPGIPLKIARPDVDMILAEPRGARAQFLREVCERLGLERVEVYPHKVGAEPYAVLFFLCRSYFDVMPDPITWVAYVISLLLAFLVGFYFEASVGMVGFWFLEVTSLLYIVMTLNFFISGHMLPLDLLPPFWVLVLKALPFQYMAYFPAVVFLGKVKGWALVYGLIGEAVWAVAFMALARGLYRLGLRRYSAYGG